jgi:cyclopropane fatty-acyl-phospholipid synthase-like methyltransferase
MKCVVCEKQIETELDCNCEFPQLSSNSLSSPNANLYSEIATSDISRPIQDVDNLERKARADARLIMNSLPREMRTLQVLEIGPGLGHLGRILAQRFDYYAADIVPNYLREFPIKPSRAFLWDITDGGVHSKFDAIVACDVFEHVLNEGDAWFSAYEALKAGGILYLRVPYKEPLINYSRLLGAPHPYIHLRSYSLAYLREMSRYSGFSLLRIKRTYNHTVSHAQRRFGSRAQRAHAQSLVSLIRQAYLAPPQGAGSTDSDLSSFKHRPLLRILKQVFDGLGPNLQSLLRTAFNFLSAWAAPIFYRPTEITLVLKKKAPQ